MGCSDKLFVSSAHDIPIVISDESNLSISDIADMTVELKPIKSGSSKVFTTTAGQIDISAQDIVLLISESDITVAGFYKIVISIRGLGGKTRRVTPCPPRLRFYE